MPEHPHPERPHKVPLVLVKPPKKIGDMTDEELHAFADWLFHQIKSKMIPVDSPRVCQKLR